MRSSSIALVVAVLVGFGASGVPAPRASGPGLVRPDLALPDLGATRQRIQGAIAAPKEEPVEWMRDQRLGPEGLLPAGARKRALRQAARVRELTRARSPELLQTSWTSMGPTNFGGRVADLAVDPSAPFTVYAGTAGGGVWKSTDGAVTFAMAWPNRAPQAIGAIAVAADGTVYAGTGEASPGGGSTTFGGEGLYRSTDGGGSWKPLGLKRSGAFGRIVVDPTDTDTIYAAAAGDLYTPGGQRGLYRSTDRGRSWKRILTGDNPTTGAVDVAIDPSDPDRMLVAMWDHQRIPTHRIYGGPGSGVYLTTNGGKKWIRMKDLVAHSVTNDGKPEGTGRIGVAFAPSDPSRAYAVVVDTSGDPSGLWRSDDGGETWTRTAADPGDLQQSSFGWWFGRIFVDPVDPDRLFVAGVELIESIDGGDSFVAQSRTLLGVVSGLSPASVLLHADQHAMAWDPNAPGRVYLGNDGGMYWSAADGRGSSWVAAASQGWTQHYSVDVGEQQPGRVVSGLQDNMCQRNYLVGETAPPGTWTKYGLCGDGLQTLIDFRNDNVVYGCAQYGGNCSKTVDGGVAFVPLGGVTSSRFGWWMPIVFDPNDPNVLYAGGNLLNRSTDGGMNWSVISPDLTTNPIQLDPNPGYRIYGTITTVAASASDPSVLYVGTDDARLWTTKDLGEKWVEMRDGSLPRHWITRVAVHPENAKIAYATYSGYRAGSDEPHVVMTKDGGRSWKDISGNLPDAPVNDLIFTSHGIAVANDIGVYTSSVAGKRWLQLGSGLPAVPIFDIRYHRGSNTITAATFGHGIQRVTLPD